MVVCVDLVGGLLDGLVDLLVLVVEGCGLGIVLAHRGHLGLDCAELLFVGGDRGAADGFELAALVAGFVGHDVDVNEVVDVDDTDVALAGREGFGAHCGAGPDGACDDEGGQQDGDGK